MEGKRKARAIALIAAAAAALILASCQLAGVTQGAQADGSAESRSLATSKAATTTIYCTAAINPVSFFFEFDIDGAQKKARVLLPIDSDSYIQDGKGVRYKPIEYKLAKFDYDQESGGIYGETVLCKGVAYCFYGTYDPSQGFFGYIVKTENGVASNGFLGGVAIAKGSGYSNYVGEATYLFDLPVPQTLLFNVAFNPDTGIAFGTWCESGAALASSIHGFITGSGDEKGVQISAIPLYDFAQHLEGPMSASGQAAFKNPSMNDASGTFDITYCGVYLPSLLTATKETR
jgi:hypothetical protein